MIHHLSDGDVPAVGATVLALGDGDSWAPVAPADPHDLVTIDLDYYAAAGVMAADLPWADADVLGLYAHEGAPQPGDWQRLMADIDGAAVMVACLPACWLGEVSSETDGWIAVVRETLQSEAEAALRLAVGRPALSLCIACRVSAPDYRGVGAPAEGSICSWCGDHASVLCVAP